MSYTIDNPPYFRGDTLRRVGKSTSRVTKGGVYECTEDSYIQDNYGARMKASRCSKYWQMAPTPSNEEKEMNTIFEPGTIIRRTEDANIISRCSGGTDYKVLASGRHILDNEGKEYLLTLGFKRNWEVVYNPDAVTLNTTENITEEEIKMLNIKNVDLINDQDAEKVSQAQYLKLLQDEEASIESLQKIKTPSETIKKIKTKHRANIKKLVQLMDKYLEVE